ncbi:MAG: DUF401 family protein [Oscillospiraceae bacterium]|nr:DUF401 family protein [Oscillospiraceae bacterium]
MRILFLCLIFLVIILLLAIRRPLYQAITGGLIATALLYRIPLTAAAVQTSKVFTNWNSFSVILALYCITYLQRMLESRKQIKLAQQDLNGIFHNRRINAAGASLFIGLLPSAAAMILCGDIVKDATEGYLKPREQAFVTSWFRHIPESSLPTYTGVLLMANLSGLPLGKFMVGMIIPVIALFVIAYYPYLNRIPKDPGTPPSQNRFKDVVNLFKHLWTLLAILVLILVFKLKVVESVSLVIAVGAVVYKFKLSELIPMFKSAFEMKLLLNTTLVLVLKEFIAYTGVLEELPEVLAVLPIPSYLVFALLFFAGTLVSGTSGIIALGTPLAFAAMDGGIPLMVLLMCMTHAASQVSPIHVCLVVASEYFHITLSDLIKETLPRTLLFCLVMIAYYNIMILF